MLSDSSKEKKRVRLKHMSQGAVGTRLLNLMADATAFLILINYKRTIGNESLFSHINNCRNVFFFISARRWQRLL